ncbi:hypothetical protein ACWGNM_00040 [Streptomyces sp. NPDC055796]
MSAAAIRRGDESAFITAGDVSEAERLLGNELLRSHLDWDEPIALLHMGTLHHYNGEDTRTCKDVIRGGHRAWAGNLSFGLSY